MAKKLKGTLAARNPGPVKRQGPRVRRKLSPEQLKTTVWDSENAALADLKLSHMPRDTEDYMLGQSATGWQLLPVIKDEERVVLIDDDGPVLPESENLIANTIEMAMDDIFEGEREMQREPEPMRESRVLDALRKKPGAKPRGEAKVLDVGQRENGHDQPTYHPGQARALAAPRQAEVPNESPGETGDALASLPFDDGPFEIVIRSVDGSFPQSSAVLWALDVSRKLRVKVWIRNGDALLVRGIDATALRKAEKPAKAGKGVSTGARALSAPRLPGEAKALNPESKFGIASRLLFRPNGATGIELEKACGWENVTQRYINRASAFNANAEIVNLGNKHWKLIKR